MTYFFKEERSKCSNLYLEALSRDIFERHTMHHSKELSFYLYNDANIFSLYCLVLLQHIIFRPLVSCHRIIIIFESDYFKTGIFKNSK